MNLENIPEYLKENASWCLWKYETRNNKETKIPFNPITESYASVNKPNTFTTFDKASEKLWIGYTKLDRKNKGRYN